LSFHFFNPAALASSFSSTTFFPRSSAILGDRCLRLGDLERDRDRCLGDLERDRCLGLGDLERDRCLGLGDLERDRCLGDLASGLGDFFLDKIYSTSSFLSIVFNFFSEAPKAFAIPINSFFFIF
jgi:hypothetical protein